MSTASCWSADEVQSGVGRTGKWWAIEHTGVQPDIVCMAKGIASGMPLGVVISKAEVMDWVPGSHASTFGGNPVCIAAALATLDVIEKEGLLTHSTEVGDYMMKRMADWPKKHRDGRRRSRARIDGRCRDREGQRKPRNTRTTNGIGLSSSHSSAGFCFSGAVRARSAFRLLWSLRRMRRTSAIDVLDECIAIVEKGA